MSIVNADAKSLEWITFLFISQDKNGIEEWLAFCDNPKLNDIHTKNQNDFNLGLSQKANHSSIPTLS